jgi:hypothetical protein
MVDILAWLDKKSREQQLYVGDNKSSTPWPCYLWSTVPCLLLSKLAMNDLANIFLTILLAALLSFPWVYSTLDARTFSPIEGITAMNLVSGCQLQYYTPPAQPEDKLLLACPGMDTMRLRPWPVEQPWN